MGNPSTPPPGRPIEPRSSKGEVTRWLNRWTRGERQALDRLVPLVYAELRRIAGGYAARRPVGASLQPTALINEAFVRLIGRNGVDWKNRAHFFGVAAKTMRGILVDEARKQMAEKRGGLAVTVSFDEGFDVPDVRRDLDLVVLDSALTSLAEIDPELSELVELRYFGGLTIDETASVLGVSAGTVKRSWTTARAWLRREMSRR